MVAPRAGAWIETSSFSIIIVLFLSLPARERGLKLNELDEENLDIASLPARERGLKHICYV